MQIELDFHIAVKADDTVSSVFTAKSIKSKISSHFWIAIAVKADVTMRSVFTTISIQNGYFPFWIGFVVKTVVR